MDEDFQEISYMAEFVALFYAPWFFKSSLSSDSPLNDLDIIDDMRKLRDNSSDDPRVVIALSIDTVNFSTLNLFPWLLAVIR